jgi:chromosome segregation ATPase
MDAISFVLGVKGSILRSSQLSDLIYRPTTQERGAAKPKKATVCIVYQQADGTEMRFQRSYVAVQHTHADGGRSLTVGWGEHQGQH